MRVKPGSRGAVIDGCSGPILAAAIKVERLFVARGVELVICEGMPTIKHSAERSRHYSGDGIDVRSKMLPDLPAKKNLAKAMRRKLGPDYVVILESVGKPWEHYHIHWAPIYHNEVNS